MVAVSIPVQLDVGLTVHRRWFVGAYVAYAWDVLQIAQCKVGESCSVTGLRLGLQATYAFRDQGGPWVGLGTGWEWMFTKYSSKDFTTRLDVGGWEIVNLQAGYDVVVLPGLEGGALDLRIGGGVQPGQPGKGRQRSRPPTRTSPTRPCTAGCSWE